MTGPVVVGYDGSKASEAALTRAIEEARSAEAALVVVSVVEMPLEAEGPITFGVGVGDAPLPTLPIVPPPETETLLEAARARIDAAGIAADYVWETGDAAGAILREASDRGASAIVVGKGHHSRLGRWLGTDTAAEIERAAGCRVIVVDA